MKKYMLEWMGTFLFVVIACGTEAGFGDGELVSGFDRLAVALAFGLTFAVLACWSGGVLECQLNPAVSVGMLLCGRLRFGEFLGYVLAQCTGAAAGAGVLRFLLGPDSRLGANRLFQGDAVKSLAIEALLTFVLVLTFLASAFQIRSRYLGSLLCGGALVLVHLFGLPFTGASVNPARSLGPALFAGGEALSGVWVFLAAPMAGGILAAAAYRAVFRQRSGRLAVVRRPY